MKQIRLIVFLALCAFACQGIFGETYSSSCGENVTWTLDTSTGVMTISGTGAMNNYDYYKKAPWCEQRTSVRTVIINKGVTSIGYEAFYGCSSLASIILPESLTSIGGSAFYECSSLTSIILPEGVTSIGGYAFFYCSSLTSITIPKNVRNIGKLAFSCCPSIKSVTVCGSRPPICGERIFDDAVYNNATLYVPVGTSTLFYVATGWMNFWTITETDTKVSATDMDEAVAPIYDFSGRRIDAADAVHGIYIQNGKKVYKR